MDIRFAETKDCASLLAIYAQYMDTAVTFECALPGREEFAQRVAGISEKYPYLVCEEEGRVLGYAYASRHMEREAYQWNAELSVYLDRSVTSRGMGKKMYCALMDVLKLQGVKTVYGCVTVPNEKSEGLHLSLGFRRLGTYRHTGYKCGKWQDVSWFEKQIGPYGLEPAPVLPIGEVDREELVKILTKYR